jgi:multicomponent Na+:H+ antiporter subunit E
MRLLAVAVLTGIWVALWRGFSVGVVVSGVLVATAVVLVLGPPEPTGGMTIHPGPAVRYLARFARDLVKASAVVAWEVVTPTDRTRSGIVAVPLAGGSDWVTTIVANTISLVPGTLTVDVRRDPTTLYVHVLHLDDPDRVRAEIHDLERLARRAFAPHPPAAPAQEPTA